MTIVDPFFNDPEQAEEALVFCEQLASRLPDEWWVHYNVGILAGRLGKTELAQAATRRAEELRPK